MNPISKSSCPEDNILKGVACHTLRAAKLGPISEQCLHTNPHYENVKRTGRVNLSGPLYILHALYVHIIYNICSVRVHIRNN